MAMSLQQQQQQHQQLAEAKFVVSARRSVFL